MVSMQMKSLRVKLHCFDFNCFKLVNKICPSEWFMFYCWLNEWILLLAKFDIIGNFSEFNKNEGNRIDYDSMILISCGQSLKLLLILIFLLQNGVIQNHLKDDNYYGLDKTLLSITQHKTPSSLQETPFHPVPFEQISLKACNVWEGLERMHLLPNDILSSFPSLSS